MRCFVECVPGTRIVVATDGLDWALAPVGAGKTVILRLFELQSDGTLKQYDFNDNTFKTTALTTATTAMTHRTTNNGTYSTSIYSVALTTLTGFTAGNTYIAQTDNTTDSYYDTKQFVYARTGGALKVEDGGITAASLASATITAAKFGSGAIDATAIASDAITAAKIADNAIDAGAIATGAITAAKFAAGAIDAAAIADNAIDAGAIAADAITAAKIADNAIDAGAIASAALTSAKFATGALAAGVFGAGAITAAAVADGAIDAATLAADLDVYEAVAVMNRDSTNELDEWTVYFKKNGVQYTGTVTTPVLTVTQRDATVLFSSSALTQVGSTGFYKVDKSTTSRVAIGETYLAQVTATIAGSSRTFAAAIGRDG